MGINAVLDVTMSDPERSNSRPLRYCKLKKVELGHMQLLNTNWKLYMKNPMATIDLTLVILKGNVQGHSYFKPCNSQIELG